MSEAQLESPNSDEFEVARRDFINAIFALLKNLGIHDLQNEALIRPKENFLHTLQVLQGFAENGVELKLNESLLTVCGQKLNNHFSIVEASKQVPRHLELALMESLIFEKDANWQDLGNFFQKWALHCSVHQKSKAITGEFRGVKIAFVNPEKANIRLKSKQLLMSPSYALNHYYVLKNLMIGYFKSISSNQLISQREVRREILEMTEIARVNPYQLVGLSLLRGTGQEEEFEDVACEAISTALLSIVLAKELDFSTREQVNIGVVGLMYNVGLLNQELSSLLKSDKRLSQAEYKKVMDAQSAGVFKLIKTQGSSRPALERLLALFEATQGNFKKSISLTLDSRLLRMVSQYVALTSHRPFRDAYHPAEAMKILGNRATSRNEGNLDPVLYYLFVRYLGVYPVGSLVLLSNGKKAVVFRPSGEKVGVPMLKLVVENSDENSILIDLSQETGISIVKSLDPRREGVQVSGYFFD
ncbi:MAG: hypothetical protein COV44_06415 [Deltaproteobacteria bacterium CG11_big_fil_rev_8_21_14_0_20_45_16]|nr:MAG: hypothetical protein COV44_06415 [Deltaproteobacteria bacterium CG11_big_fil_rev_8_21_14_0_20_45_16]